MVEGKAECAKCKKDLGNSRHMLCKTCRSVPCKLCGAMTTASYVICIKHPNEQANERQRIRRAKQGINDGPGPAKRLGVHYRIGDGNP